MPNVWNRLQNGVFGYCSWVAFENRHPGMYSDLGFVDFQRFLNFFDVFCLE